jgi:4-oxalocrotonate tautomerase
MPHVIVKLYPGKSDEIKTRLAREITKSITRIADCKERSVSVSIQEIEPEKWAQTVYKPDIIEKAETLFKKPGYNPFETKSDEYKEKNNLMDQVRAAAEIAQNSDVSGQFNAMSWLDEQLEDTPDSFDHFFDTPWHELSDAQRDKRAMAIRSVL